MNNIIGLVVSFGFIFLIIILSSLLKKLAILNEEGSRKFIHIAVGNWWLIAMYYHDDYLIASIVPFVFIILNYLSFKFNLIDAMERDDNKENLGTVYYPISLLVLVIVTFGILEQPYIGALGILIMAYGDGLAAIFGKRWGRLKIYHEKSLVGSLVMLAVSAIVTVNILSIFNPEHIILNVIIISITATLLELYSKRGLDNLSVPILTSLVYYILTLL